MSRTRRCAPSVESWLLSLAVVPAPSGGFLVTMTVQAGSGPEWRPPITVTGEGETVAKDTGAATAAAWKALQAVQEPKEKPVRPAKDRRQLELVAEEEG